MRRADLFFACAVALSASNAIADETPSGPVSVKARFKIDKDSKLPWVPVTIDGKTYTFLLHTALTGTVIDQSLQSKLGTAIGTIRSQRGVMRTYKLPFTRVGSVKFKDSAFAVCVPLQKFRQVTGLEVYGMIGRDLLGDCILRLDFDNSEWSCLSSVPPNSGEKFDYRYRLWPSVPVRVDDTIERWFTINTFSNGSVTVQNSLFKTLVDSGRIRKLAEAPVVTAIGTSTRSRLGRLTELRAGKQSHRGLWTSSGNEDLLGLDYLSRYTVTIDFPNYAVYLKKGKQYSKPDACDLSGLHLWDVKGQVVVALIDAGSVADRAGMKPKDAIVHIGNKKAGNTTLFGLRRLLTKEGQVEIVFQRGKEQLRRSLVLKQP